MPPFYDFNIECSQVSFLDSPKRETLGFEGGFIAAMVPAIYIFILFICLLIKDGERTSFFLMCAMQFLHFYFRFPRRTTPVSTGCSAWRDSTRVMLFLFIFLAPVFGAQMCAVDSDIVYLILSARIAGTCAVNILLICFYCRSAYSTAMPSALSLFLSLTVRSRSD